MWLTSCPPHCAPGAAGRGASSTEISKLSATNCKSRDTPWWEISRLQPERKLRSPEAPVLPPGEGLAAPEPGGTGPGVGMVAGGEPGRETRHQPLRAPAHRTCPEHTDGAKTRELAS